MDVHAGAADAVMGGPLGAKALHLGAQFAESVRYLAVAQLAHGLGEFGDLVAQVLVRHGEASGIVGNGVTLRL